MYMGYKTLLQGGSPQVLGISHTPAVTTDPLELSIQVWGIFGVIFTVLQGAIECTHGNQSLLHMTLAKITQL